MRYSPEDGTWQLGEKAALISELRNRMTPEEYAEQKQALKEFLCGSFRPVTAATRKAVRFRR